MAENQLLEQEIQREFGRLESMEIGSEEYKTTVDGLTKLIDRKINMDKLDKEFEEKQLSRQQQNDFEREKFESDKRLKREQMKADVEFKNEQIKNEKKDMLIRNGIAVAGLVIPSIITIWGTFKTLKFEETGSVTTIMGRGFINKLLPKK